MPSEAIDAARRVAAQPVTISFGGLLGQRTPEGGYPDWLSRIATNVMTSGHSEAFEEEGLFFEDHPGDLAGLGRTVVLPLAPQAIHAVAQNIVVNAIKVVKESANGDAAEALRKIMGEEGGLTFDMAVEDPGS